MHEKKIFFSKTRKTRNDTTKQLHYEILLIMK